ncbi:HAD superfamily hydrolase [Spiroplasma corruscae]|uniref:HAD superfamily hydrolase n=1 Tax=Spiroplasma corruscae TaxID=216934 RepID=A0A222ENN5_9MOLU|nr:Cof-type HAD-IIB family hydrolase [Spiroplasma corruscae]ASP27893.1 HAD superfamily hydrolase [Spiroplasma corruscae]
MKDIKLIVMDIDGTILGKGHEVTSKTLEALQMARSKNVKICLATGRHFYRTKKIAETILSDINQDYVICLNGAGLYKYNEKKSIDIIEEKVFTVEEFQWIYNEAKKLKLNCWSYDKQEKTAHVIKRSFFTMFLNKIANRKSVVFKKDTKNIAFKILANGKSKSISKLKKILRERKFRIYDWSYSDASKRIEISPKGVNKAYAVKKIAELENISKDNIMFFGDGDNDKELLGWCKYGVAMGNAHEEVAKNASYKTLKNTEDGVAHFINKNI